MTKEATKDNPKSIIFVCKDFKALRFSLHHFRDNHCHFASLAIAPSNLNHFGRCYANVYVHLHCSAIQSLSSPVIVGTYLHSWWVLLCYLPFKHPCLSQIFQRDCLRVNKPRLGEISLFKLSYSLRECFLLVWHLFFFFVASGLSLLKLEAQRQIDEESSVLSEHLPISVSFIFPSLLETVLRALFAFQLLPNIVQMVLMSHHCRSFIF